MKGGKKVEEETKKPCTPVEEAGRDYNELGLYLHSKENNRTLEAAQTLWEFLPGWMAARKMAVYDPDYNRSLSGVIAENAEIILKAAQDMAGWGQAECEPARKEETPQDKPLPEHLIDCASALLTLLKVCVVAAVTDVRNRENRRLSGDNAAADFGFHCRQNSQSVKGTLNFKHDFVKHGWLSSPFSASIAQIGE